MTIVAGLDDDVARVIVYVHRGFCLIAAGELSAGEALIADGYEIANRLNQPFFAGMAATWAGIARCDVLDPADAGRWYAAELAQPRTANSPRHRQVLLFRSALAGLSMGAVEEPTNDLPPGPASLFQVIVEAASAYMTGEWAAGRSAATTGLDLARRSGNRYFEFSCTHQLARLALAEGDRPTRRICSGARWHWWPVSIARTRRWSSLIWRCTSPIRGGWRMPALQCISAALRCVTAKTGPACWVAWCSPKPRSARRKVGPRQQQGVFRQAVGTLRHYQLPWDEAQALECWGGMLIKAGEAKEGDGRLDAAAVLYRRHGAGARWLQRLARLRAGAHQGFAPDPLGEAEGLSHREVEVLSLVAAGRSNQEIADALVLSVRTVERHLAHVYDKLGVGGKSARAGASAYGIAHGLVPATTIY